MNRYYIIISLFLLSGACLFPNTSFAKLSKMNDDELRSVTGQAGFTLDKEKLQNPDTLKNIDNLKNINNSFIALNKIGRVIPDPVIHDVGRSIGRAIAQNPEEFRKIITSEATKELLEIAAKFAQILGQNK